jgi:hypothetical protein
MTSRAIVLTMAVVLKIHAQSVAVPPSLDRVLQIAGIAPGTGGAPWEIRILNISAKAVTGFCIGIEWHYANGQESPSGLCRDLAPGLALDTVGGGKRQGTNLTFRPGEFQTVALAGSTARDGSPAAFATAAPKMVIFEDRTSLGDQEQKRSLLAERKAEADETGELVRRLQVVQSSPDRKKAMNDQLGEVGEMIKQSVPRKVDPQPYQRLLENLQEMEGFLVSPDFFDLQLQLDTAQANFLAEHSVLKDGGGR